MNLNENPIFTVTELESLITDRTLILICDGEPIETSDSTLHALGSAVRIAGECGRDRSQELGADKKTYKTDSRG